MPDSLYTLIPVLKTQFINQDIMDLPTNNLFHALTRTSESLYSKYFMSNVVLGQRAFTVFY